MLRNILFLILSVPVFSFAQKGAKLSGAIQNTPVDAIEVIIAEPYLGNAAVKQYARVVNGTFDHSFEITKPTYATLVVKDVKLPVFLEPGDEMSLNVDPKGSLKDIRFTGKGAENNNLLQAFHKKFNRDFNPITMKPKLITNSFDELEMLLFDNKKAQWDFLKGSSEYKQASDGLKAYLRNQIDYNYWRYLFAAPVEKAEVNNSPLIAGLPKIMTRDFNPKMLAAPNAMMSESYREFLLAYTMYQTNAANGFNRLTDKTELAEKIYEVATGELSGLPLVYVLSKQLYDNCNFIQPEAIRLLHGKIAELDKDGTYTTLTKQKCGTRLNAKQPKKKVETKEIASAKPQPAAASEGASFTMLGMDGKDFTLDDLKGKVVYIDFWASWCGPCRQQFPFAKDLKAKLTKKQLKKVEFLYISIDRNESAWKKAIDQYKLEGVHGFSAGGWGSEACKYFKISSIPRYMLMDKKGNIVNPNAPRPSQQDKTLGEILKLLES